MLPTDHLLLGMLWKGESYVDTALPLGFLRRFLILGSRGQKKRCGTSACSSDLCIPGSVHRSKEDGGLCHKACV